MEPRERPMTPQEREEYLRRAEEVVEGLRAKSVEKMKAQKQLTAEKLAETPDTQHAREGRIDRKVHRFRESEGQPLLDEEEAQLRGALQRSSEEASSEK